MAVKTMADYIKREDAIRELNAEGYTKNMRIHKRILDIPAADVRENVQGEWKNLCNYDKSMCTMYNRWMCSLCGYRAAHGYEYTRAGRFPTYNFCPNCGADMRGENDG